MEPEGARHLPADPAPRARLGEDRPLDFRTPYGCSKGVADQYVLDYAKSYGLPAAVLRMSCVYGPRQFGTEDQGWVAHFLIRALEGRRSRSTATGGRCATCSTSRTPSRPTGWCASGSARCRGGPSTSAADRRTR
jgi:nucleoside-diphosphate-sugar epimerase